MELKRNFLRKWRSSMQLALRCDVVWCTWSCLKATFSHTESAAVALKSIVVGEFDVARVFGLHADAHACLELAASNSARLRALISCTQVGARKPNLLTVV